MLFETPWRLNNGVFTILNIQATASHSTCTCQAASRRNRGARPFPSTELAGRLASKAFAGGVFLPRCAEGGRAGEDAPLLGACFTEGVLVRAVASDDGEARLVVRAEDWRADGARAAGVCVGGVPSGVRRGAELPCRLFDPCGRLTSPRSATPAEASASELRSEHSEAVHSSRPILMRSELSCGAPSPEELSWTSVVLSNARFSPPGASSVLRCVGASCERRMMSMSAYRGIPSLPHLKDSSGLWVVVCGVCGVCAVCAVCSGVPVRRAPF